MRTWIAAAGGAVGALLVGYALLSKQSPEEAIAETLDRLEATLALNGETTNPLFLKAHFDESFEDVFTEEVAYQIPELSSGKQGRSGLSSLASGSARYFNALDVDLRDREVELTDGDSFATVHATAVVTATRGAAPERDERRVRFELRNGDDGFRIDSVRVSPPGDPE